MPSHTHSVDPIKIMCPTNYGCVRMVACGCLGGRASATTRNSRAKVGKGGGKSGMGNGNGSGHGQHCAAVLHTGELYTWGEGGEGQLGHGGTARLLKPRKVMALDSKHVSAVSCGGAHTAVVVQVRCGKIPNRDGFEMDLYV